MIHARDLERLDNRCISRLKVILIFANLNAAKSLWVHQGYTEAKRNVSEVQESARERATY